MPKLPRISGADCIAALQRLGFAAIRQRGSHVVLRRGSQGCVVPVHRELKAGTLHGILKQAGIDVEEFLRALSTPLHLAVNLPSDSISSANTRDM